MKLLNSVKDSVSEGELIAFAGGVKWYPPNEPPDNPVDGDAYYDNNLNAGFIFIDGEWKLFSTRTGEDTKVKARIQLERFEEKRIKLTLKQLKKTILVAYKGDNFTIVKECTKYGV